MNQIKIYIIIVLAFKKAMKKSSNKYGMFREDVVGENIRYPVYELALELSYDRFIPLT